MFQLTDLKTMSLLELKINNVQPWQNSNLAIDCNIRVYHSSYRYYSTFILSAPSHIYPKDPIIFTILMFIHPVVA